MNKLLCELDIYCVCSFSVDYVLKDPEEKARLHIVWTPRPYPIRMIRAPVPWHETYSQAKDLINTHLFITNPMMLELQYIWFNQSVFI